jgi:hypothetical protein
MRGKESRRKKLRRGNCAHKNVRLANSPISVGRDPCKLVPEMLLKLFSLWGYSLKIRPVTLHEGKGRQREKGTNGSASGGGRFPWGVIR